jgi:ubiquinone/menaquinone biosynthesis C-methylase UbiE
LIDLGSAPPSNAYLTELTLKSPEKWFPLKVMVCTDCWLVQTEDYTGAEELFDEEYAYFSSFSSSWLNHAEQYVNQMVARFDLNSQSNVIEIAANDGYLLQYVKARNIPCIGIEPTASTAKAAREKGVEIIEAFFNEDLADELVTKGKQADLITANNVLAHVPDINDFISSFQTLLKPNGVATFEFPHLIQLIDNIQFDTIYHEHFSYLSLTAVNCIFEKNGLQIFDVEELRTHGGSLRVYAQRKDIQNNPVKLSVNEMFEKEIAAGVKEIGYYENFQMKANKIKDDLLRFLIEAKINNKTVIAYGAAAKGSTLLNYAGVRPDLLPVIIDLNPNKQNKYMPGSRIPIKNELEVKSCQPDYVFILPWNIRDEVQEQLSYIKKWGGQFVIAVPELRVN